MTRRPGTFALGTQRSESQEAAFTEARGSCGPRASSCRGRGARGEPAPPSLGPGPWPVPLLQSLYGMTPPRTTFLGQRPKKWAVQGDAKSSGRRGPYVPPLLQTRSTHRVRDRFFTPAKSARGRRLLRQSPATPLHMCLAHAPGSTSLLPTKACPQQSSPHGRTASRCPSVVSRRTDAAFCPSSWTPAAGKGVKCRRHGDADDPRHTPPPPPPLTLPGSASGV